MLKLFQIAVLFVLFIPLVSSETKIFSGKVITDTDTEIEDIIFRFSYSTGNDKLFVSTPSENLIVENGGCKSARIFRVCVNSVNFSYKNITTYVYYYEANLDIYKLTGSLEATTKSTLAEILHGETATITITIKNPADSEIERINFIEDFSPFEPDNVSGCTLIGTKITWNGSLQSNTEQLCTANIIAKNEGEFTLTGNLEYYNGVETEKRKSAPLAITVLPKQLKVSSESDKEIEAGQEFFVNFTLQNLNQDEDIEASLWIELPDNVELFENISDFTMDSNILMHETKIVSSEEQYYSLHLKALSAGNSSMNYIFNYTIKGLNDIAENEILLLIKEEKQLPNSSMAIANASTEANLSFNTTQKSQESKNTSMESKKFNFKSGGKFIILPIVSLILIILAIMTIKKIRKKRQEKNPMYKEAIEEIQEKVLK